MTGLSHVEKAYAKTRAYITPGYGVPCVDESSKRKQGMCLHHSFTPFIPETGKNYAEELNDLHFGKIEDWHREGGVWTSAEGSLDGLHYDFVISWDYRDRRNHGGRVVPRYWTSMRWILQLMGDHAVNRKHTIWHDSGGKLIKPNSELISICVIGDYNRMMLPEPAIEVIREIGQKTGCGKKLFFHSDFSHKVCPGAKMEKGSLTEKIFGGLKNG
jgi:hypothetical protein